MLHKIHKHDLIIIFAVLGLADSIYLEMEKVFGFTVPCGLTGGCDSVLHSKYSLLFSVPLPIWGMVFFASIIILGLLANHYGWGRRLLTLALGAGSIMALVFLSEQFFVIKKICEYCLVSDVLTILLFLWDLNIDYFRSEPPQISQAS